MVLFHGTSKQAYRGAAVAVSAAAVLAVLGMQGSATDVASQTTHFTNLQTVSFSPDSDVDQPVMSEVTKLRLDRACLSGIAHPIGQPLDFDARLAACNRRIESTDGRERVMKVLDRARLLHFTGSTIGHRQQAYLDFSLAIAFGIRQPSIFAARGKLNHTLRKDPSAAISDYDRAIHIANGSALPSYYLERAKCKVALGSKQEDLLIFGSALQDVDTYLAAFPESENAVKMRRWLVAKVEPLLEEYSRPSG